MVSSESAVEHDIAPAPTSELRVAEHAFPRKASSFEPTLRGSVVRVRPSFESFNRCCGEQVVNERPLGRRAESLAAVLGQERHTDVQRATR